MKKDWNFYLVKIIFQKSQKYYLRNLQKILNKRHVKNASVQRWLQGVGEREEMACISLTRNLSMYLIMIKYFGKKK